MNNKRDIFFAIIVSVFVHIFLFFTIWNIKIPNIHIKILRSRRLFRIEQVNVDIPKKVVNPRRISPSNTLRFDRPESVEAVKFEKEVQAESKQIEKDELVSEDKINPMPLPPSLQQDDLEELVNNDKNYKQVKDKDARKTRKELVELSSIIKKDNPSSLSDIPKGVNANSDFFDKMPGFTPKALGENLILNEKVINNEVISTRHSVIKRKIKASDLKEYLTCNLVTYTASDGEKYFKIGIRVGKDGLKLPIMPKEIVFLIDCSSSIGEERFNQFKQGLKYCLENLNKGDYFNIGAFKKKILWFRPHSVKVNKSAIREAKLFVDRLIVKQKTDAYNAFYQSIKIKKTIDPSYIIFFSDGRPTEGETNAAKIVSDISKLNNGQRPIFAVSGGMGVNRYFLDFIAYKNRGWAEYTNRTHMIKKQIIELYSKIKSPLLLHLRYHISGLDESQIYPKSLPDFFRNAEFSLYGKYTDENKFSLQLLGDMKDEQNEFIIVSQLDKAERGGEDIARNWAFNKIYYLIGLLEYGGDNEKIEKEIDRLCTKFHIHIPYIKSIEK